MTTPHELAMREAVRHLDAQAATVGSIRAAAGTILAAASIGSSFLAPIALENHDGVPSAGLAAIIALGVTVVACLVALWPVELTTTADAATILGDTWAGLDGDALDEQFVEFAAGWADGNDDALKWRGRAVSVAVLTTGVALIAWIALIGWR